MATGYSNKESPFLSSFTAWSAARTVIATKVMDVFGVDVAVMQAVSALCHWPVKFNQYG
ncbi:MAG TPA: hypothetical protein VK404_09985 [Spirosoma sp.]|nr:hypothetical protein [Spirosoma sp.]